MAVVHKVCQKCGRSLDERQFWKLKTGERADLCRDCLTANINNRDPETFKWILKLFDVPYIAQKWTEMSNEIYKKDPSKFGSASVIGRYIRSMNMTQYRNYHFSDTDRLNGRDKIERSIAGAPTEEQIQETEEKLRQQLESGEISEAEYATRTTTNINQMPHVIGLQDMTPDTGLLALGQQDAADAANEAFQVPVNIAPMLDDSYWTDQLEDDDYKYLILKWGSVYTPEQWIKMEQMYNQYAQEYDMNVDREETLKKMCKTSLKMDEALDTGDVTGYKNLAQVFDQLRKSGKFTEAQNKEKEEKVLDTVGELVALVEQEGGIIPHLPQFDPDQYPQDKIDFTLKDLQAYTYNLVSKELGLGDLIESYIEKLEKAEREDIADVNQGLVTSAAEEEQDSLTDEEIADYMTLIDNDIEAEAEELLKYMDGLI